MNWELWKNAVAVGIAIPLAALIIYGIMLCISRVVYGSWTAILDHYDY